jgi:glucan phosphoethanolaminetransferase (alkaline phosphatase superfamily)
MGGMNLKLIPILVILQGLAQTVQTTQDLINAKEPKLGTHVISTYFNIIPIVFGIFIIAAGIGMIYRKRRAYISTIVLYAIQILILIAAVVFYLVNESVQAGFIILMLGLLGYFIVVIISAKDKLFFEQ